MAPIVSHTMTGALRLESALRAPAAAGRPALVAFLTGGFPTSEGFLDALLAVAEEADAVEIGVPFSDPMADGVTIQRASRAALEAGTTLEGILVQLDTVRPAAPLLLMSYLNPLISYGLPRLARAAEKAGVDGLIVPDLPFEECGPLREAMAARGVALVQMVTPLTPPERAARLCRASRGFVYAVTTTGITGGRVAVPEVTQQYLARTRALSPVPVLAGFGIREANQVRAIAPHADGVIVGSALIERLENGGTPDQAARFLAGLRPPHRKAC
jgi:tryptophan synthase alpha chain